MIPKTIISTQNEPIPFETYCKQKAEEANARWKGSSYTAENVLQLAQLCQTDQELDSENPKETFQLLEEICQDIERSKELEAQFGGIPEVVEQPEKGCECTMTEKALGDGCQTCNPEMAQQIQEENAADLETSETVVDFDPEEEPEYADLEIVQDEPNSQDILIVESAKNATVDDLTTLSDRFDFGTDDCPQVKARPGAITTPMDYAVMIGAGYKMGAKSIWIVWEAIAHLRALGKDDAVEQIGADLQMSRSTLYNGANTCKRIAPSIRALIPPTVAQEICTARFSKDAQKNEEVIQELLEQAASERFSCTEARDRVLVKKEELGIKRTKRAASGLSVQLQAISEAKRIISGYIEFQRGGEPVADLDFLGWIEKYGKLAEEEK